LPDVIANGTQCKHERAQDGCFVKEKWDERWFQTHAVKIPNLLITFNGTSGASFCADVGATCKVGIDDTPQADKPTGDSDECLLVSRDEPDGSEVAAEMTLDSDNDMMTLASLGDTKPPAAKSLYKYKYNSFMEACAKLATAVQNRPQVAEAVHGTIVTLLRIAQGQESEIDNQTFNEIIEGARATFGAKRQ
jgi:hypothetical protein